VREPRVGIEPISVRNRPTPRGRALAPQVGGELPGGCRLGVRFALTLGEALFSGSKSRSA
jgi:hypothetical protein